MGWPTIIHDRVWMPDPDHSVQRKLPEGIVIHSGDKTDRVAESSIHDGRDVSYHVAHSREHGKLVQLVSLHRRAWHAGKEGNDWLSIALSGPYTLDPRTSDERDDFRLLLEQIWTEFLSRHLPPPRYWCRHSDITPGKLDPGPGFTVDWLDGFDLLWRRGPGGEMPERG